VKRRSQKGRISRFTHLFNCYYCEEGKSKRRYVA
jgi:hypothetical protein